MALSRSEAPAALRIVRGRCGGDYLPAKARVFRSRARSAQEAHEAIRPTDFIKDEDTGPERKRREHKRPDALLGCRYGGEVMRVMFMAEDPETIRQAFRRVRPNGQQARLYDAAVARRQTDHIYKLSLTRTATVTLPRGKRWHGEG